MSKKYIQVDVVGQNGLIFTGEADIVSLRGSLGVMAISYGHTQLLSTLPPGSVEIKKDDEKHVLYISGGIVEVTPTKATFLVDEAERSEDLVLDEISKAKARAKASLDHAEGMIDTEKAHKLLLEAEARLKTLNSSKGLYYSPDNE